MKTSLIIDDFVSQANTEISKTTDIAAFVAYPIVYHEDGSATPDTSRRWFRLFEREAYSDDLLFLQDKEVLLPLDGQTYKDFLYHLLGLSCGGENFFNPVTNVPKIWLPLDNLIECTFSSNRPIIINHHEAILIVALNRQITYERAHLVLQHFVRDNQFLIVNSLEKLYDLSILKILLSKSLLVFNTSLTGPGGEELYFPL